MPPYASCVLFGGPVGTCYAAQALAAQRASAERERQAAASAACKARSKKATRQRPLSDRTASAAEVKASAQRVAGELQRELSIEEACHVPRASRERDVRLPKTVNVKSLSSWRDVESLKHLGRWKPARWVTDSDCSLRTSMGRTRRVNIQ